MKRYYSIDALALNSSGLSLIEWTILENIHFLSVENGWCFASKKLLSSHHDLGERAYQKTRAKLVENGWLKYNTKGHMKTTKKWFLLQANKSSDEVVSYANKSSDGMRTKVPTLPIKKEKEERVYPALEEIEAYILEKNLNVSAKRFLDYFEAGDWKDKNGNKVKNWKQKILTWDNHAPQQKQKAKIDMPYLLDM